MNNYFISGGDVKKLFGCSTTVATRAGGNVKFTIPGGIPGWPRSGLEAYGVLIICEHPTLGSIPSFLKIFKYDVPERSQRSQYLTLLGLHKQHPWLFQGIPYASFKRFSINGTPIVGHVARQVTGVGASVGEDIDRLRSQGKWNFSLDDKRRLCGHLCAAVAAFEKLQLVHGDISLRNLMIGKAPDGGVAAILCDYDGFYHPSQKLLPETFNGLPCRPLGTSGFQPPYILKRLANNQSGVYVDTDRFAMGAMVCDIMAWADGWSDELGREDLLGPDEYGTGKLSSIPYKVRSRCKEGFDLLEVALNAKDAGQLPSPQDWFQSVIGVSVSDQALPGLVKQFANKPFVEIHRRHGTQLIFQKSARITQSAGGLEQIDQRLKAVTYENDNGALKMNVGLPLQIFHRRGSKQVARNGPAPFFIQPGDTLYFESWQLDFSDRP